MDQNLKGKGSWGEFGAHLSPYTKLGLHVYVFGSNLCDSTIDNAAYTHVVFLPNVATGKYGLIASGCKVIDGTNPTNFVPVYLGFYDVPEPWVVKFPTNLHFQNSPLMSNGRLSKVENDVWIGPGATIMLGVTIHNGAACANALAGLTIRNNQKLC